MMLRKLYAGNAFIFQGMFVDHPLPGDLAGKNDRVQGQYLRAEDGIVNVPGNDNEKRQQSFVGM